MSSVPQGAFVAKQVHCNNFKHAGLVAMTPMVRGNEKSAPNPNYNQVNTQNLDHPLTKYNSKLMNSIWGMYNRYSVHNLKKITEGEAASPGVQQLYAAVSPSSSGLCGTTGGFQNGLLANPAWEGLFKNGHTY